MKATMEDLHRWIKWSRNELAAIFVERHPSNVIIQGMTGTVLLNLPTAILTHDSETLRRAQALIRVLRQATIQAERLLQSDLGQPEEQKKYQKLLKIMPRDSGYRLPERTYTRDEVLGIFARLRKRYGRWRSKWATRQ